MLTLGPRRVLYKGHRADQTPDFGANPGLEKVK
jgi:hypothetical protein